MKAKYIITVFFIIAIGTPAFTANYIWTGNSSSNWSIPGNWSGGGGGTPGSGDNITINSNAPNNLVLDQNRTVTNFTINGDTLDLGTYSLTTTGVTYFNGGKVLNGILNISGSLCHFGGAVIDARIEATCGYYHMNGGSFLKPVILVSTGAASTSGSGNCVFEDSLSITNNGTYYFYMSSSAGNQYDGPLTIINNSTHEVYLSSADTSYFSDIVLSNTSTGGIVFGNTGGVSFLASGKTISIGSGGFTKNDLTLKNFYQQGSTSQTLTLTGTAILNLINANFEGNLTVTTPGILLKNSTFNGITSITRNGTSGSFHCDGGNTFTGPLTLTNSGTSGRLRMANTTPDTYRGNVTFNSTNGQDVQIAYTGNNIFEGNITINSNKVVFNTSNGKVTFAGGNSQSLNGSYNYSFKKLAINKSNGYVTSNATFSVDDTLFFIKGSFITKSTNELTLKLASKVVGASDSSYVEGPVKKMGNTGFVFPTGDNNSYRPIEISAPSTTTSEFVGEFVEDSLLIHSVTRASTLGYLNRSKYWKLNRTSGTSQVYVTLSWNAQNALVDTFVTIASWNGTQWSDLGKGTLTGSTVSGTLKSSNVATAYNEFTFGYFSGAVYSGPCDCGDVSDPGCLELCLYHPPTNDLVEVTGPIFLTGQSTWSGLFPLPVFSGITLQSSVGTTSPKWWEPGCLLISTNHLEQFISGTTPVESLYLFAMQPGATIQNLRLRGANLNGKDFNESDMLCGGIYVYDSNGATSANILNCEISCFSQAGVWKDDETENLNIENCYVHKIKGKSATGIGYGVWTQSLYTLPLSQVDPHKVDFINNIFDDCKTAIDGQAKIINWNILNCSLTQFFSSEDINMHNNNKFTLGVCPCTNPNNQIPSSHYFYDYKESTYPQKFFGAYWASGALCEQNCSGTQVTTNPGPAFGELKENSLNSAYGSSNPVPQGIPFYDVGGIQTTIANSIFHKKWKLDDGQSNINLNYPNRDSNKGGSDASYVHIVGNTFTMEEMSQAKLDVLNLNPNYKNRGGFARISDNSINADVWSGDIDHIVHNNNNFSYVPGMIFSNSPIPCSNELELTTTGNVTLPQTHTKSANVAQPLIQYVDLNTAFKINTSSNATSPNFIIRPNPNANPLTGTTGTDVISNENYFYDQEIYTSAASTTFSGYDKPGLYGIDVLAFDVEDYDSGTPEEYYFKSSAWNHIPVIVKGAAEQTLYFNIKDSYEQDGATTGVKKQAYLNDVLIWSEDISEGGAGWEYVEVDLSTTTILSALHTDGTPNVLSFSIFMNVGISTNEVAGVSVRVDDIYIPVTGSATGESLVKDGTCELTEKPCETCDWFINAFTTSISTGCGNTAVGINGNEKRSGNQSIYLTLPFDEDCDYDDVGTGEIVASIGTYIDFTDLLSCYDYWTSEVSESQPNGGFSNVGFEPFPGTLNVPYSKKKFWIGNNIVIDNGETLTFEGCELAISPGFEIVVNDGGTLTITYDNTNSVITPAHLFSCDEMWQGITVKPGGTLTIEGETTSDDTRYCKIENALVAIKGDGNGAATSGAPEIYVNQVSFNSNMISVELTNDDFVDTDIMQCLFECEGELLSKAPHIGDYPQNHILIENALNVQIGDIGNQNNVFKDIYSGVKVISSDLKMEKGEFINLVNHNAATPAKGFGIIALNNTNTAYDLDIDSRFNNLSRGIFSRGNFNVDIIGVEYFRDIDDVAIALFHFNYDNDILIDQVEEFLRVNIGVLASGSKLKTVIVSNNKFTNTNFVETSTTSFHNTAITIRGQGLITGDVIVQNNQIKDYRIGIHSINILRSYIYGNTGPLVSSSLQPMFNHSSSFSPSEKYRGIWLQNCPQALVQENLIDNDEEITSLTTNFRGIDVEHSTDCHINCNEILNIPYSFHFFGNCDGTLLRANEMTHYDEAIRLEYATIANQFQINDSDPLDQEPTDNIWNDPDLGSGNPTDRVTGPFNGFQFNWLYRPLAPSTPNPFDPLDGGMTSQIVNSLDEPASAVLCDDESTRQSRHARFGATVGESLSYYIYEEENTWMARKYAYESLKADTTLLYGDTLTDAAYQAFFWREDSANTGKFATIRLLGADSATFGDATVLNELVIDEIALESNLKSANSYYFTKYAIGDSLDNADSTAILEIAILPYFTGGEGTYITIGMMGLEHTPSIPELRMGLEKPPVNIPSSAIELTAIYPNPAVEYFYVRSEGFHIEKLEIYDTQIKLLKTIETNIVGTAIPVNYKPGIYGIKLYLETGDTKWFKLVKM